MKRIVTLVLALVVLMSVFAIGGTAEQTEKKYADGTELRMATGYNNARTGIAYDSETVGSGLTLIDTTYYVGDLKPTWAELEGILGVKFNNVYQGNSATNEFKYWQDRLQDVDMVSGTAATLSEVGEQGMVVNLAEYLDIMPNFKAYLEANPIVRLSITGNTDNGAIYFSPYFDGVNDIERMPLMRVDWAVKLLDGEGAFTAEACNTTAAPVYTPYMPTEGKVEIETPTADASATQILVKDYDAYGNIVAKMNEVGSMNGVDAVNMLRDYIDATYGGYYGTERSKLFVGQDAAWDADELVALLRCVVANPQTLNGTDSVQGLFSREDDNNQRRIDMFRFAGHLFGVRGMESRHDFLYVGTDGELHDARQEAATYEALARMNALTQEGLISVAYIDMATESSKTYLEKDLGFMSYDYNQTQTVMNATALDNASGEKYMAVMVPVAKWFDGTDENGVFMRFTESWRSVKTDGWAISKAGVGGNDDKLYAALALIDYAYSEKGQILMSYGPDKFIMTNDDGSYVTFNFNGKQMPVIADETYELLWSLANGNYTNFARYYLGSTLSFVKSQAFEYQCTHEIGKEGAGYISNAIGLGTIKHPELDLTENPWYTSVPTVLPNTVNENAEINNLVELSANGYFSAAKGGRNLFVDIIVGGLAAFEVEDAEAAATVVNYDWYGDNYLEYKNAAWDRLTEYYATLN